MRVWHTRDTTTQNNPSGNDNEKEQDGLESSKEVHAMNTNFREECVNNGDESDHSDGDTTLLPFRCLMASGVDNVGSENDASRGCDVNY